MKQILVILFLIPCAFISTIYALIFPEDIYGKAHFFVLLFEFLMLAMSLSSFFLIQRFIKKRRIRIATICFIGLICFTINLNILPTSYGPGNFLADGSAILNDYEKVTLNDFKDSYQTEDVLMNNAVLEKFGLSPNLYHIKYLDISDRNPFPKTIEEFPIWIEGDKAIYDNNSLTTNIENDVFIFLDNQYANTITFLITTDGLNRVENFYTGGGTNQHNIRESGTIDQKNIRIVVSMSNHELEVDNSYGKLMSTIIQATK